MFDVGIISDQVSMIFEEALGHIAKWGIKYVELHALWNKNIEELDDVEVSRAKALLDKHRLKVSLISSTLFLLCPLDNNPMEFRRIDDYFITIYGNYGEHLDALKRCIELCRMFGTDRIRTFGFLEEKPLQPDMSVKMVTEKLLKPVEMVEKAGLTLLLENCPHSYLPYGALTKRVIEAIGSKSLKALWDPANAFRAGGSPYPDDYREIKSHVVHVHAKDLAPESGAAAGDGAAMRFVPLGRGVIGYGKILKSFRGNGFSGVVSLEPEFVEEKGGRPEACRKSLEGIRAIVDAGENR